ncbi:MAG: hypothetical protein KC777_12320 [Cyanobacteria bacterium HKST-UBA02]|nr:hypothetical protein [Cyanobacteria bacterium HKST-UBA02]
MSTKRLPGLIAASIAIVTAYATAGEPTFAAHRATSPATSRAAGAAHGKSGNSSGFEKWANEKNVWKLLDDPRICRRMRAVAGNDIEHFRDWAYASNDLEKTGNDLFAPFTMIGGAGYTAFFDFNYKTGHACLGFLEDDTWHIYGAGKKLPAPVQQFLSSENGQVKYEKPNPRPVVSFKATSPKKNLNISNITGTYEREPTRFTTGILKVRSLPDEQVEFNVFATLGGRTGGTSGTVPLIDHRIVYKTPDSKPDSLQYIKVDFHGQDAVISGTDEAFCGAGVTLGGHYHKIDDRPPIDMDSE